MLTPAVSIETISFARDIRPRTKQERSNKQDGKQDDEDLRELTQVIMGDAAEPELLVDESGDVVADIEDEPDRNETGDAVDVDLQKISDDVAVEQFHGNE